MSSDISESKEKRLPHFTPPLITKKNNAADKLRFGKFCLNCKKHLPAWRKTKLEVYTSAHTLLLYFLPLSGINTMNEN